MPVQQGDFNRPYSSRVFGQAAIDAQRDPGMSAFDPRQIRGDFDSQAVDRIGYQDPQPWGPPNSMSTPWNAGNPSQVPYSPTPLQNSVQQPMNPTPMPQLQPQPDYSNSRSPYAPPQQPGAPMPSWPPQQPGATPPNLPPQKSGGMLPYLPPQQPAGPPQQPLGTPPYFGSQSPAPGYSLPGSAPPGISGPNGNGFQQGIGQSIDAAGQDLGLADGRRIIRIPIRLAPDERIDIRKEDVILHDGDIVFIEARDTEVFFTGGLLGGGQFTLPRDFDLDILQALSIATSRNGISGGAPRAIGGVSALNSDVTISPSNVVIIRKLPEGGEIPIKVDLYQARNDLSERIIVQPGDYIYLQYTPMEAICAFVDRHLLEGALFGLFAQQLNRPSP